MRRDRDPVERQPVLVRDGLDRARGVLHRLARVHEVPERRVQRGRLVERQAPEVRRERLEPRADAPERRAHGEWRRRVRPDDLEEREVRADGLEHGDEHAELVCGVDEPDLERAQRGQPPALALQEPGAVVQVLQVLHGRQPEPSARRRHVARREEGADLEVREAGPIRVEVVQHHVLPRVLRRLYFPVGGGSAPLLMTLVPHEHTYVNSRMTSICV